MNPEPACCLCGRPKAAKIPFTPLSLCRTCARAIEREYVAAMTCRPASPSPIRDALDNAELALPPSAWPAGCGPSTATRERVAWRNRSPK